MKSNDELSRAALSYRMATASYSGASEVADDSNRKLALQTAAMLAANNELLCELIQEVRHQGQETRLRLGRK